MKLVKIIEKLKEQGLLVSYEGDLDIEIENVWKCGAARAC